MRRALPLLFAFFAPVIGCGGNGSGGSAGNGGDTSTSTGGTGGSGGTASTSTGGTGGTGGTTTSTGGTTTSTGGFPDCGDDVAPPNEVLPDTSDPEAGDFTLDEALVELPEGPGPLRMVLDTDMGAMTCTFHPAEAPIAVANFIGLARGRRAWKDTTVNKWVRRPFYDGLIFHRVIAGFVAQGGDPKGTGFGGPGYKFKDEIAGLTHVAGTLAYANSGPNTNGSQFYICETPQPQLDSKFSIFGECEPVSVVEAITHVMTDANDKPLTPIHIKSVKVTRCAP